MKNKYEYVLEELNELLEGLNDNNDYRFEHTSTGWVDDIMFNGVLLYDSDMDTEETETEILNLCKIRLKKLSEVVNLMISKFNNNPSEIGE